MPEHDTSERDTREHDDTSQPNAAATDALVERWFFESFHGSAIARSTEAWNVAHAAKEELKRRLATLAAQPDAATP